MNAQQSSLNSAGDFHEDSEATITSNYWTLGELIVGNGVAGDITNYSGLIPAEIIEEFILLGLTEQEIMAAMIAAPNPTLDLVRLNFQWQKSEEVLQQVFDATGKLVWEGKARAYPGENNQQVEMGEFPSGLYVVRIVNSNGEKAAARIIKK